MIILIIEIEKGSYIMDEKEKIAYASAKPTEELLSLFERAKELDADGLGKAEILERAELFMVEKRKSICFKNLSKNELNLNYSEELPTSFKVRINNEELDSKINNILKEEFNISRLMTPFKLKIVLSAYINFLQNTEENVIKGNKADTSIDTLRIKAISLILKADKELLKSIIASLGGEIE